MVVLLFTIGAYNYMHDYKTLYVSGFMQIDEQHGNSQADALHLTFRNRGG